MWNISIVWIPLCNLPWGPPLRTMCGLLWSCYEKLCTFNQNSKGLVVLARAILMVLSPQPTCFLLILTIMQVKPLSVVSLNPIGKVTTKGRIGSSIKTNDSTRVTTSRGIIRRETTNTKGLIQIIRRAFHKDSYKIRGRPSPLSKHLFTPLTNLEQMV